RVRQLTTERAERELITALAEHGAAWTAEVDQACSSLLEQWTAELAELATLHGRLEQSFGVARVVSSGKVPRTGSIQLAPSAVQGREWASQQPASVKPYIPVGDVLAGLSAIGQPEPERQPVEQPPLARKPSELEDRGDVQAEMAERGAGEARLEARRQQL